MVTECCLLVLKMEECLPKPPVSLKMSGVIFVVFLEEIFGK
jgi:hypothetical protein